MNAVKTNLKRLRLAKGMTQDELAEKLHVVRQTVSSWETGKTTPDVETLTAIAEALGVEITELIYGEIGKDQRAMRMRDAVCWAVSAMACGVFSGCWKALLASVGITSAFAPGSFVVDPVRWGLLWFGAAFLPSLSFMLAGITLVAVVRISKPFIIGRSWLRWGLLLLGISAPVYYFSMEVIAYLQYMNVCLGIEIVQAHFFFFYRNPYVFTINGVFLALGFLCRRVERALKG